MLPNLFFLSCCPPMAAIPLNECAKPQQEQILPPHVLVQANAILILHSTDMKTFDSPPVIRFFSFLLSVYLKISQETALFYPSKIKGAGTKVPTPCLLPHMYSQNVLQKAEATSTSRK